MENLTVIIPFYNGFQTIDRLLRSLPADLPVLIVDDMSDPPLLQEWVDESLSDAKYPSAKVIRLERKGYFAGAVNRGIQESKTDVLVLNQDTWFDGYEWEKILADHSDYGMVGERIKGTHPAFGELGYIHGTFAWFNRKAIREVGLLNEKDYPLWGNTAEYQWRVARKNFKILPIAEIPGFHHERPTTERFGSSIKNLLEKEPEKKSLLVRTPPILSVIVPVYNYGRYLMDCIASLIGGSTTLGKMPGQTLQSMEIIIVDDASTDNSMDYIKQVTSIEKGIRAYHLEKNVGTARALNFGIEQAVGKYITFLSADDMREPDSLEKLVEVCEQNPHSFAYDDVWIFNKNQRGKKWPFGNYDFEALIWQNHVHAGIVFPRAAWQEVGGYPAAMNDGREDWAFNIALGLHGWCGVHLSNYGYLYRREGQNRTETNTTETHRERFLAKIMGLFPDVYKGKRPIMCCGKGNAPKSNNGATSRVSGARISSLSSTRSPLMAEVNVAPVGREPMERIEYLGNQMNFTVTGDMTNAKYTFGKDRPKGWVFKSDVGERGGKLGFLSKRENGKDLYRIVGADQEPTPEPVAVTEVTAEVPVSETPVSVGASEAAATLQSVSTVETPDPTDLTVEELKAYADKGLTKDQWEQIYKKELAGRNRKGAIAFIEDLLANWPS